MGKGNISSVIEPLVRPTEQGRGMQILFRLIGRKEAGERGIRVGGDMPLLFQVLGIGACLTMVISTRRFSGLFSPPRMQ